jgi:hypothetical protein
MLRGTAAPLHFLPTFEPCVLLQPHWAVWYMGRDQTSKSVCNLRTIRATWPNATTISVSFRQCQFDSVNFTIETVSPSATANSELGTLPNWFCSGSRAGRPSAVRTRFPSCQLPTGLVAAGNTQVRRNSHDVYVSHKRNCLGFETALTDRDCDADADSASSEPRITRA